MIVSYVFDLNIIAMLINNAFKMTVIENVRYRIEKEKRLNFWHLPVPMRI